MDGNDPVNMIGDPQVEMNDDWRGIPTTRQGKKARSAWIGRNAFNFPEGKYHLHARWLKGTVQWVLSGRGSALCKEEGRCRIVQITNE